MDQKNLEEIAFRMSFCSCFTLKWLTLAIADITTRYCLCKETSAKLQSVNTQQEGQALYQNIYINN